MYRDTSGLDVDPAFVEDRDADMSFTVHTSQIDAAARALDRALPRLRLVTYDGREFADDGALDAEVTATNGEFDVTNASYVGEPERAGESLHVYVDTDGAAPAAMGATFVAVLSEELARAGVTRARLSAG